MKQILSLLLAMAVNSLYGQQPRSDLSSQIMEKLGYCISSYYEVDSSFSKVACIESAVFIKFKISESGKLDSLDFTAGAPEPIRDALTRALLKANGSWTFNSEEKKKLVTTTFVLPFLFNFQDGCPDNVKNFEVEDPTKRKRRIQPVQSLLESRNKTGNAVADILNFKYGYLDTWNCKILAPIKVGATLY